MQTNFTQAQLQDPVVARADGILRSCVHCGLCTATCPTYVLLGDERDSPRGRIYLIKQMFEQGQATPPIVRHIDRCLSCLACMTACPSGVDYMHLIDLARDRIERTVRRPPLQRGLRWALSEVLPSRSRFRMMLFFAWLVRPLAGLLRRIGFSTGAAALSLVPSRPSFKLRQGKRLYRAERRRPVKRVALMLGCVQEVLQPSINRSAIRLLQRHGVEVITIKDEVCCGALAHHLGREEEAIEAARHNINLWSTAIRDGAIDAILIATSGCGTMVKDYGNLLARDQGYAERAATISALTRDITEFLDDLGLEAPHMWSGLRVAYQSACSLQHGQRVETQPRALLRQAGFTVVDIPEGHLCCGSAGIYNILQPQLASALRERKLANIESVAPDVVAAGNIGCIVQLADKSGPPVVHTVELLDWATGGPCPKPLKALSEKVRKVSSLVVETMR